jgi:ABC-type Zn uptake system ZnuABC Zn-binding protein ZnuA
LFLNELSLHIGIPIGKLLVYEDSGKYNRKTWAHPQVAINIAQWISSAFDVQVSNWVYEIMITDKVDIMNSKTTKELDKLREENKNQALQIQYLQNKYVKAAPRFQYIEKYVIYIVVNDALKIKGQVKIGMACDLTERLSTYNTSCQHEVLYHRSCKDEDTMNIVDKLIKKRLAHCRFQANREYFIGELDYLIKNINECIDFVIN